MNKWYRLFRYTWPLHFVLLLTNWLPDNVVFINLRGFLARPFFKKCGKGLGLGRNLTFYDPSIIEIGHDCYIAYGCWFNGDIIVEDEVLFGPYCILAADAHTKEDSQSFRFGGNRLGRIRIKSGSWLGAHSIMLMNSELGRGSILAANSTLTEKAENDTIYAGSPARRVKVL